MEDDGIAQPLRSVTSATFFYVARAYGGSGAQYVWSLAGKEMGKQVLLAGFSPDGRTARLQSDSFPNRAIDSDPILPQDLGCYRVSVDEKSVALAQNGVSILTSALSRPIPFETAGSFELGQERDEKGRPASLLRGDISEVLVFDRALNAQELALVERYLQGRYGCGLQGR